MKIAYLITAYNNYLHLERLINALDDGGNIHFYIHIDKKSDFPDKLKDRKKVTFVKRIKVWWGGWSHQAAILRLMKAASLEYYDYYVLLSGADYPIRPNSFLYEKLTEGGEFLNLIEGFQEHKPENRVKYYYFDLFDRRNKASIRTKFFLPIEKKLKYRLVKKNYPFKKIYHGSTWWALSFAAVEYIVSYTEKNPRFVRFFKTCWCPEESFIPTIIGNSPFKDLCKTNLTFTDWSIDPGPAFINLGHLELFRDPFEFKSPYGQISPFFARKFENSSLEIIKEIERSFR